MYNVLQGLFCQPVENLAQSLNDQPLYVIQLHFSVPAGLRNVMSRVSSMLRQCKPTLLCHECMLLHLTLRLALASEAYSGNLLTYVATTS